MLQGPMRRVLEHPPEVGLPAGRLVWNGAWGLAPGLGPRD